jgi:hypothetical protein
MKKLVFNLMTLATFLFTSSAMAQIPGAVYDFDIVHNGTPYNTAPNTLPDFSGNGGLAAGLTLNDACEGDQIILRNYSTNVPNTTLWDIGWGDWVAVWTPPNMTANAAFFVWSQVHNDVLFYDVVEEKALTIPTGGGVSSLLYPGMVEHTIILASEYAQGSGWFGLDFSNGTAGCNKAIVLRLLVKKVPDCIEDQFACNDGHTNFGDLIPSGVTASNWSPFDPAITSFTQDTEFTVTLSNGNGCEKECSFWIKYFVTDYPIVESGSICEDDLPYIGNDPFVGNYFSIEVNGVVILSSTVYDQSWFNQDDLFVINEAGEYIIVQTFYTGVNQELCTETFHVTVHASPVINVPSPLYVCNNNFLEMCGPAATTSSTYSYEWWGSDPILMQSVILSTDPCFTPTALGSFLLTVTDDQTGCTSSQLISILQGYGVGVEVEDVSYCGRNPKFVGLEGNYSDAISYTWTYEGTTIFGQQGYQIAFQGDGEYCVTIVWDTECVSTACFDVEECCDADPDFEIEYDFGSSNNTITVTNNPLLTPHYDWEQWILYRYCGSETDINQMTWSWVNTITNPSNFNNPQTWSGLTEGCSYMVVHNVTSDCKQRGYQSTLVIYGGFLKIAVAPNPVVRGQQFGVTLTMPIEGYADLEVIDMATGARVLTGTISNDEPFTGTLSPTGRGISTYAVKVTTETEVAVEYLQVQ